MRGLVALAFLATGCDIVLGLQEREDDERPAFCTEPELFDGFTATGPECPWGVTYANNATIAQRDGALEIAMTGAAGGAGCTAFRSYSFTEGGVFLNVRSPLRVTAGFTLLGVRASEGGAGFKLSFDGNFDFFVDDMLRGQRDGEFVPWWRIRRQGSNVVAEVSADASTWEPVATYPVTVPEKIALDLVIGITSASSPGTAILDAVGVCQ